MLLHDLCRGSREARRKFNPYHESRLRAVSCAQHQSGRCHPRLIEQAVLNPTYVPGTMKGWRLYRIEYGFECSCPEGVIWLPPHVRGDLIERILGESPDDEAH